MLWILRPRSSLRGVRFDFVDVVVFCALHAEFVGDASHTHSTTQVALTKFSRRKSGRNDMSLAPDRLSIGIRRHFTNAGVHPYLSLIHI